MSKYGPGMLAAHEKFLDWFKKSAADPIKTAIQNPTEVTGDLIGNKIADNITTKSSHSNSDTDSQLKEISRNITMEYQWYMKKKEFCR